MRGRWPRGPEGASSADLQCAPSVAPRHLPRVTGEELLRAFAALYHPRIRNRTEQNQTLPTFTRRWIIRVETARMLYPPRREERARGQRPSWRRGAIERGQVRGGYSDGPGMSLLGSPARRRRGRGKGFVPLRSLGLLETRGPRSRQGLNRATFPGRWRITVARSVGLRQNGNNTKNSGRRPALRIPFHPFSERSREADEPRPLRWRLERGRGGVNTASNAARRRQLTSHPIPGPSPSRGRELKTPR